jgi:hypothetical protein
MAFLRKEDYFEHISEANLNQVLEQSTGISGDEDVLTKSELKCITRAKEYLTSRFKVDRIFANFKDFDLSEDYTYGDRINFSFDEWEASVYLEGEFVNYNGRVFLKNATTAGYTAATLPSNATFFTNIAEAGIYYIAFPYEYNEDNVYSASELVTFKHEIYKRNTTTYTADQLPILPTNTNYFTRVRNTEYLTELTVTGVYPSDSDWTFGDNRNQTIVECIVHMAINKIHSIINPRNIPQTRRDNFSAAIAVLKEFQEGNVQADLPNRNLEGAQTGNSIRFGSGEPTTHGY